MQFIATDVTALELDLYAAEARAASAEQTLQAMKNKPGPFDGEITILRNGRFLCGVNPPFVEPLLDTLSELIGLDVREPLDEK